ncbi:putative two pore domain potassium channel family protein [Aeromonas phage LAh_9]|uniref:Potassium channel domain-containing protein n=4 Tax=Lahexavirus TaxID=2843411 RepID=A0A5B9N4V0_9CAUD|nr:cAMP-dependent Kef-type K+ transporter [Aeromonas phage 4_4572]YP_009847313.1 cAMP-dependent Kef-type K+ transporter [Aeromonas phage LAh_6]YP_009847372.1 cAMP-dependent Kef-type K+ transporter [Aeromonas phage LAh_8]YP_009847512.1 cAMP-dependent Kef-type K+ transporter [Aeromonas phage LAh_9]QDH46557.1 putative two pore domain potassium channel family protein [Aeromonas phage LAh_6]QDH46793.1 putative two pore domain potassium channel family protein [Aeromonas phage LAh_8]QDH46937.1 putat
MLQRFVVNMANSLPTILWMYAGSLVVSAVTFSWAEGRTLLDGLWWSCATALTIGYGDIAPVTNLGKFIGLIFAHFWVLVTIPFVVANIIVKVIRDDDAFTNDEQELIKSQLSEICEALKRKGDL